VDLQVDVPLVYVSCFRVKKQRGASREKLEWLPQIYQSNRNEELLWQAIRQPTTRQLCNEEGRKDDQ
jgi:hypothetical protein